MPAEWEPQSFVQITWPNADTDWHDILDETIECYRHIAAEISKRQPLVVVTADVEQTKRDLQGVSTDNMRFVPMPINDTWARDHGFITVLDNGKPHLLDFQFNGWGLKFASNFDNLININLAASLLSGYAYENHLSTVLEGGSIESDGKGTILTTAECLLSPNRNGAHSRAQIEEMLCSAFGAQRVLWVEHGYLAGDDTDSHIDTLARLAPNDTILYVKCTDAADEHFDALQAMEADLQALRTADGKPYRLVALPMCSPVFDGADRIPATYANYLYINGAVLVPIYNVPQDEEALAIFRAEFPDREIVGINCSPLIKQHGSLHCVTMQFPQQVEI